MRTLRHALYRADGFGGSPTVSLPCWRQYETGMGSIAVAGHVRPSGCAGARSMGLATDD